MPPETSNDRGPAEHGGTGDVSGREGTGRPGGIPFPETRWTWVMGAAAPDTEQATEALRSLAAAYRPAVRQWFVRAGVPPSDAEDLSQDFVVGLLEGRLLGGFRRNDTRFRAFLQTCLRNFLRDVHRRRSALKRGGGSIAVEWDDASVTAGDEAPSARALDEEFARLVHRRAVEEVRGQWEGKGLGVRYAGLERFMFATPGAGAYEEAGRRLALSHAVVKKTVFDLRQAYFQAVRRQVAVTVGAGELAEELRFMVGLLARIEP